MRPLHLFAPFQLLAVTITYRLLGLAPASPLGQSVDFFLYNVPTVLITLAAIVFVMGLVWSFVSPEATRRVLSRTNRVAGSVLAALLGIAAPLCSGSAVPLFMSFAAGGVPLGVAFSFLNAAPMVNVVAVALVLELFGWKVAALYLVAGLAIAVANGVLVDRMRLERFVEPSVYESVPDDAEQRPSSGPQRLVFASKYTTDILGGIWLWIVGGLAIGAVVQGWLPTAALVRYAGPGSPFAVPIAVAIAIPLYSNVAGVVPIVGVLVHKGVATGTVLAFMMAFVALSLPEFLMLRKVMKLKLILAYAGLNFVAMSLAGYLLNWLVPLVR